MGWLFWTIVGIAVFALILFIFSCAWLSHFLDSVDEDDKGDWY